MAENIFASFDISGQGMSVQRMRLSAVAKNIANLNTTKDTHGGPYQRDVVVVRAIQGSPFEGELQDQIAMRRTSPEHAPNAMPGTYPPNYDVLQARTVKDSSPPRLVYDPEHPDADDDGYVKMPNINIVTEMVEMMNASRSYQNNVEVVNTAKELLMRTLDVLKS